MKAISAQMDTIKKAYEQEIDAVLASFEKSYQEMVDNERSLKALMEQQKNEAIEVSKIEVEYKPLQRMLPSRTRRCTVSSATRQKEIDITGPMKTNNVRVLERAIVPGYSGSSPARSRISSWD